MGCVVSLIDSEMEQAENKAFTPHILFGLNSHYRNGLGGSLYSCKHNVPLKLQQRYN